MNLFGQNANLKFKPVYIVGKIEGDGPGGDSIRFIFQKDIYNYRLEATDTIVKVDANGYFSYKSMPIDHPGRITIILPLLKNYKSTDWLKNYLVESGDSVSMNITKTHNGIQFIFSGKGSAKYSARHKIDLENEQIKLSYSSIDFNQVYLNDFSHALNICDSFITNDFEILAKYKNRISHDTYPIIKADVVGYIYSNWLSPIFTSSYIAKRKEMTLASYRKALDIPFYKIDETALSLSFYYMEYLLKKCFIKTMFESNGELDYASIVSNKNGFLKMYQTIRSNYSGLVRERLLFLYLMDINIQDGSDAYSSCLRDALSLMHSPEIKKVAYDFFMAKITGSKAFNFSMQDTSGHIVKLQDLKGKVVYIDIWFTGCFSCMRLAKEIKENVWPEFKTNHDIIFVSISMDRNKEQWLKSVREEKYGLKDFINLYTNGNGLDDPFCKYYGIQGAPATMVIDKNGRIYSTSPPKLGGSKELITLLKDAIKNKEDIGFNTCQGSLIPNLTK
jgi:peroxiredoxin